MWAGTCALLLAALLSHVALGLQRLTDGDPVDLQTGLYVARDDDIDLGGDPPLRLVRTYRNRDARSRAFGIGTSHSLDLFLEGDATSFRYIDLILADGMRIRFERTTPGRGHTDGVFVHTASTTKFYLARLGWNAGRWEIVPRDGDRYSFLACHGADVRPGQCGLIEHRSARGGELTLTRDRFGNLTYVSGGWFRRIRLHYDGAHRIVRAESGIGPEMTSVEYRYDTMGRLSGVTSRRIGLSTIVLELAGAYRDWRLPQPSRMWERTMSQYSYDDRHQLVAVAASHLALKNEYDSAGRVTRQDVARSGVFTFSYQVDGDGHVVRTDVVRPDGSTRRVTFRADGASLSDSVAVGTPAEITVSYERGPVGGALTRVNVTCRRPDGESVATSGHYVPGEDVDALTQRLRQECLVRRLGQRSSRSSSGKARSTRSGRHGAPRGQASTGRVDPGRAEPRRCGAATSHSRLSPTIQRPSAPPPSASRAWRYTDSSGLPTPNSPSITRTSKKRARS